MNLYQIYCCTEREEGKTVPAAKRATTYSVIELVSSKFQSSPRTKYLLSMWRIASQQRADHNDFLRTTTTCTR